MGIIAGEERRLIDGKEGGRKEGRKEKR